MIQWFELAPVGVVLFDDAGRVAECNELAGKLLGCAPADVIGKPLPPTRAEVAVLFSPPSTDGGNGKVAGPVAVLVDISKRVRAERALDFERGKLASILEQAPAAICVMRGPEHVIELANERTRELLGPRDLVGRPIREAVPELANQGFVDLLDSVRASGKVFVGRELPFSVTRTPGGAPEQRFFDFVYQPIFEPDGTQSGILVHGVDITEKFRLEEQLRQSQKMEAIGRLAGGVAHDFNNLLTVITTCGTFLQEGLPPDSPLQRDVTDIREAAARAADLTNQLLAFSRRQVLRPRVLDLNEVAQSLQPMFSRLIGADIRVVVEAAPDLGAVKADRGQIEQVLMNLAVNARDAMRNGGTLKIATRNVTWTDASAAKHGLPGGTYSIIAVSDTGVGMDEQTRSRVFEPFFTTKEPGRGTGLGLWTAYGIARQSGGTMMVESSPGSGARFELALPHERRDPSDPPATEPRRKDAGGTERILLAEDEPAVRSLVRRLLERAGYTVVEARDGREALAIARREERPFDLLVTDLVMPEVGGRELYATLAAERPGLPVLFMSGYSNDEIGRRGTEQAGMVFLQKPFGADELMSAVRRVLDTAAAAGRVPTP